MKYLGQTKDRTRVWRRWGLPGWLWGFCSGPRAGVGLAILEIHLPQHFENSLFARISKCEMYVFSQAFLCFRKYALTEILWFCKLGQIWFHRLSQAFAQIHKCGFAVFHQDLQAFAIDCKLSQGFARICCICKCENHGFSQGFAMTRSTLLM